MIVHIGGSHAYQAFKMVFLLFWNDAFVGVWEKVNNSVFNYPEFVVIERELSIIYKSRNNHASRAITIYIF